MTATKAPLPFRVRLRRETAIWSRWLHLYLSMVSFAVVLFFAVTGLTLNHAEWFAGQIREAKWTGTMPKEWLGATPNQAAIVAKLRADHGIKGAVSDFRADSGQISVSFKGPGYAADGFVDAAAGTYEIDETKNGVVAVLNDLHKGRMRARAGAG